MTTLDDVAQQLREWRIAAGSPSYSELARRVGLLRAADGQDPRHVAPGRVTVYDCFRDGRSRIDVRLAIDLATVLGIDGDEHEDWRVRCIEAMRPTGTGLVTATSLAPVPVRPGIVTVADDITSRRVLFAGIGGAGKTQAAIRLLARLQETHEIDGVLTVRPDGPGADLSALLGAAAHEIGIRLPDDPAQASTQLHGVLGRRRTALFVDDVAEAAQLTLLAAVPGETVLIATSRRALEVPGLDRVDIPPWPAATVADYLTQIVGSDRLAAEPDAAVELGGLIGGLPLVAALVAARVRGTPSWSLADHVAALRERRAGHRTEDAVRASMDATHAALSTHARGMLRLLAAGPRPGLTDQTLHAVAGANCAPALLELERAYLLNSDDRRHQLHDIARSYARARAIDDDPPSVRIDREDRLIDRLCAEAWGVAGALAPSDVEASRFDRAPATVVSPQVWLAADLPGALELVREARQRRPQATIELAEALATSLERTGLASLSEQLHSAARQAAVESDDPVGETRARCALAITAVRRNRPTPGLDEIATLARGSRDSWTEARLGNLAGILAMRAGSQQEGMHRFRAAYELARSCGYRSLAAAIGGNLAIALTYAGDLDQALRWHEDTLDDARQFGNLGLVATTLSNLSETERMIGHHANAVNAAEEAVAVAGEVGDQLGLIQALLHLGSALTLCNRPDDAIPHLEDAEARAADIGLVEVRSTVHTGIGEALLARGDTAGASERFQAALAIDPDSPIDHATALHQLGRMEIDHDPARAREYFHNALAQLSDGFDQVAAKVRADLEALGPEPTNGR